jgi:hypothetical protein
MWLSSWERMTVFLILQDLILDLNAGAGSSEICPNFSEPVPTSHKLKYDRVSANSHNSERYWLFFLKSHIKIIIIQISLFNSIQLVSDKFRILFQWCLLLLHGSSYTSLMSIFQSQGKRCLSTLSGLFLSYHSHLVFWLHPSLYWNVFLPWLPWSHRLH